MALWPILMGSIADDLTGGHYLNCVEDEARRHGVAAGIPAGTLNRLADAKARLAPRTCSIMDWR